MPRSRTTNQAAGTTLNQGTNGPVQTRQRITRRRTARGAQGKNTSLNGNIAQQSSSDDVFPALVAGMITEHARQHRMSAANVLKQVGGRIGLLL